MKPLIIANWKCNPISLVEAKRIFNSVKKGIINVKKTEVVICSPFVYLITSNKQQATQIKLGGQNCFWEEKGAYTGEVSPKMLKDLGCQYVILGHSERRKYFNETDEIINRKIKAALRVKLKPIFCIGETKTEREKGKTQNILKSQIEKGLKKIPGNRIKNIIIVYEPIWAVGTGNPCDINEAQIMGLLIRKIIANLYNRQIVRNLRVVYGGSVDSKNARDYIKESGMNGLLIGKASLNPKEFVKIIKSV